jgi:hypothetical protein
MKIIILKSDATNLKYDFYLIVRFANLRRNYHNFDAFSQSLGPTELYLNLLSLLYIIPTSLKNDDNFLELL